MWAHISGKWDLLRRISISNTAGSGFSQGSRPRGRGCGALSLRSNSNSNTRNQTRFPMSTLSRFGYFRNSSKCATSESAKKTGRLACNFRLDLACGALLRSLGRFGLRHIRFQTYLTFICERIQCVSELCVTWDVFGVPQAVLVRHVLSSLFAVCSLGGFGATSSFLRLYLVNLEFS